MPPRRPVLRIALPVVALLAACALATYVVVRVMTPQARGATEGACFRGACLGAQPGEVRKIIDAPGFWSGRNEPAYALEWTQDPTTLDGGAADFAHLGPAAPNLERATFEFHDGLLVAVRAKVREGDPFARAPALEAAPGYIRATTPSRDGFRRVRLISRSCEAHAYEVRDTLAGVTLEPDMRE